MAFNLFKWFTTGNGDDSSKPDTDSAPSRGNDRWSEYLFTDKVPNPKQAPGLRKPTPQPRVQELQDRGYGSKINPFTAGQTANNVWGEALGAVAEGRGNEPARDLPSVVALTPATDPGLDKMYQAEQARKDYGTSLGKNSLDNVKELSWEEYDALSPRARAAVDANTILLAAVRQDAESALPSSQGDADYLRGVEALFGKEGGSDTYAPNTLKALQDLGISNVETGDLDQYLSGGALLRENDLPGILTDGSDYTGDDNRARNANALSKSAIGQLADRLNQGDGLTSGLAWNNTNRADLDEFFDRLSLRSNQQKFQEEPQLASELTGMFLSEHPELTPATLGAYLTDRVNRYEYSRTLNEGASFGPGSADQYIDPSELRALLFTKGG